VSHGERQRTGKDESGSKRKFRKLSRLNWKLRKASDLGDKRGAMAVMWMMGSVGYEC